MQADLAVHQTSQYITETGTKLEGGATIKTITMDCRELEGFDGPCNALITCVQPPIDS